jgi:glycosyltransferase involved in cell wall biosynthesis
MGLILIIGADRVAAGVTKVSTVFIRHSHHSAHSGYPRFTERLGWFVDARPRGTRLPAWLLERESRRVMYDWFGPEQLRNDVTAARRLVLGRGEVVHLLYGETDHFYAGRVRQIGHRRGNRLVATFHQPPSLHEQLLPNPAMFEQLDHAIALGPRAAAHLAGLVGGADRVSCAFLGVDTGAWHPRRPARSDLPTCAVVGSWFRDFDVLRDVIRIVHHAEPRARFEVVTGREPAEAMRSLPGVRARTAISDAELQRVYWGAWLHLLPLEDAVANNALGEGMACGLPTVASHVGDVDDYTGTEAARLVPRGDADAMAAAVLELLGDPHERERMGTCARLRAERRDLTAAARRHAEIYESL